MQRYKHLYIRTIVLVLLFLLSIKGYGQNKPDPSSTLGTIQYVPAFPAPYNSNGNNVYNNNRYNYIRTFTPHSIVTGSSLLTGTNAPTNVEVSTSYFNGWGAPLLSIERGRGPLTNDIVTPYDNRPSISQQLSFLSYEANYGSHFRDIMDPWSSQFNYYDNKYPDEEGTGYSRSKTYVELASPSNYTTKTQSYSPGISFTGSNVGSTTYSVFNTAADNIRKLYADETGVLSHDGWYYFDGELNVNILEGPNNEVIKEFYDKNGKIICKKVKADHVNNKWLTTYYVYDELGRLIAILPPKAVEYFEVDWNRVAGITGLLVRKNLCYLYKYDKYGRNVEKSKPEYKGKAEEIVYDKEGRLAMYRNPILESKNQWQFNVYDQQGRLVLSGILDEGSNVHNGLWWQNHIDNMTTASAGSLDYYIFYGFTGTYPSSITDCEIQTINYYDSYTHLPISTYDYTYYSEIQNVGGVSVTPTYYMYGLLTGSKIKVLDGSNTWITSVNIYDEKDRVIQTYMQSPWHASNAWDIVSSGYDFIGNKVIEIYDHKGIAGGNSTMKKIVTKYEYDENSGRLRRITQGVDNSLMREVAFYQYDQMGNTTRKMIGTVEQQDYEKNIRGQLVAVNKLHVYNPNINNKMTFGEEISYDFGYVSNQLNGRMAGYKWRGASTGTSTSLNSYGYTYDDAGRMLKAYYSEYNPNTGFWENTDKYTVWNLSYDANGNIATLNRNGVNNSNVVVIDQLSYNYKEIVNSPQPITSNTLSYVTDNSGNNGVNNYNLNDFQDHQHNATDEYNYDANGNLKEDANKGIDNIEYNYLDLPVYVEVSNSQTSGTITNHYDADGVLLKKIIDENGTTEYIYWGPFVYKDGSLEYFYHPEGRALYDVASNTFQYEVNVTDHLGNVRTTLVCEPQYWDKQYVATMEIASSQKENILFDNIDETRATNPVGAPDDMEAAELRGDDPSRNIGPALALQAMAGDEFSISAYSYHEGMSGEDIYATPETMLTSLLTTLGGTTGDGGGGEGGETNIIDNLLSGSNYTAYETLKNNATIPGAPRAYLNLLVFDSEFNLIPSKSQVIQTGGGGYSWNIMGGGSSTIKLEDNGYVVLYASNEQHQSVFINNMSLIYYKGVLKEEQHYYPHGMVIENKVVNNPATENKHMYQGKKMQDELGLQLYDFQARQYDPQLGRFWGADPLDQFPSGYTGMANDPANFVDPTGMLADDISFQSTQKMGGGANWDDYNYLHEKGSPGFVFLWLKDDEGNTVLVRWTSLEELANSFRDDTKSESKTSTILNKKLEAIATVNLDKAFAIHLPNINTEAGLIIRMFFSPNPTRSFADLAANTGGGMYDLESANQFLNDYMEKYRAKLWAGSDISSAVVTLDDKVITPYSEVITNLVLSGGVVSVGNNKHTDFDSRTVDPNCLSANDSRGKAVGLSHNHPIPHEGYLTVYKNGGKALTLSGSYSEGPSRNDMNKQNGGRYMHMTGDRNFIYLYDNHRWVKFARTTYGYSGTGFKPSR